MTLQDGLGWGWAQWCREMVTKSSASAASADESAMTRLFITKSMRDSTLPQGGQTTIWEVTTRSPDEQHDQDDDQDQDEKATTDVHDQLLPGGGWFQNQNHRRTQGLARAKGSDGGSVVGEASGWSAPGPFGRADASLAC